MNLKLVYRYILSLSKNESGALRKKKVFNGEGRISDLRRVRSTCHLITLVKLIVFNTFAHEILPVDAV